MSAFEGGCPFGRFDLVFERLLGRRLFQQFCNLLFMLSFVYNYHCFLFRLDKE